ncbi:MULTISPECIES: hypothetical protein [Tessaracoccus]|uniref:hypothetical protein n=1 Tax=Tessaracoccus TaxID=72763 RepID=UPI00099C1A2F|nr:MULTISPECIES: hypothetical protein [Tessaracoccus]AQX15763.1 hypothetical protein BKM78_07435 [Tessaracoccus sp. T2.5-30]
MRDASWVIVGLGITARSRPTVPPPRGNASDCVAAQASLAEVAPASFAEVAPDGGAVRASLEADAVGVDLLTTAPEVEPASFAEVAPDGGAVRASLEADAAGVDP